jgi:hypothetical protein
MMPRFCALAVEISKVILLYCKSVTGKSAAAMSVQIYTFATCWGTHAGGRAKP